MQTFSGIEALQIDIANSYGRDKDTWQNRLLWAEYNHNQLEELEVGADEPLLYKKAVSAYRDVMEGKPVGHNMFLDATASGLQILAALTGCHKTAMHVNMIATGERKDVYIEVAQLMNKLLPISEHVNRDLVKKPVMTHYYNKLIQDTLSDMQQRAFYVVLAHSFEGAEAAKDVINQYWDATALNHSYTMPDGHVAYIPVTEIKDARIEVDELDKTTFAYRFRANTPSERSSSLVPNIVHSVDAYIVREMIRRADKAGFELAHIFDAFTFHPNYMGQVTQFYREILAEIADSNLLANILSQLAGHTVNVTKMSNNLSNYILKSEYMLS